MNIKDFAVYLPLIVGSTALTSVGIVSVSASKFYYGGITHHPFVFGAVLLTCVGIFLSYFSIKNLFGDKKQLDYKKSWRNKILLFITVSGVSLPSIYWFSVLFLPYDFTKHLW